jgi:hypothetical protein
MTDEDTILNFAYPLCLEIPRQKKHISLIFHKKKLLSIGRNCFKTHPKAKEIGYAYEEMHSELDAYRKLPYKLCTPWCLEVFNDIYYTDNDGLQKME